MIASAAYAIFVTALWQGALIGAAAWAAIRLLGVSGAGARAAIWSAAFFAAALAPAAVFLPGASIERLALDASSTAPTLSLPTNLAAPVLALSSPATPRAFTSFADFIAPIFCFVWFAGAGAGLFRLMRDTAAMERLRRQSRPLALNDFALPPGVETRTHPLIKGPVAMGLLRPVIILPAPLVYGGCPDTLRGALAHERAHIERGDLVANFMEALALCVFWWSPPLRLIRAAIAENREMACDDRAVLETKSAGGYASVLLDCAERTIAARTANPQIALAATGKALWLARRIARLADADYAPSARCSTAQGLLAAASLITTTACATAAAPRVDITPETASETAPVSYVQAAPRSEEERLGRELVLAVLDADMPRAEQLLAGGANINAVLELDGTPLIAAVNHNAFEIAQWLIASGADLDAYARYDETALISAVRNSSADMVRLLIGAGADVDLSAKTETGVVRTPMSEARRLKRRDIEQMLTDAGARA